MTLGTLGYERFIPEFISSSKQLVFEHVCKDFVAFLPEISCHVLDAGCGVGQNAAALAKKGYKVTAVEPICDFLEAAKSLFSDPSINWLKGSLPHLSCFNAQEIQFGFVLIDGVWHHLNEAERATAVDRLCQLIAPGGRCAISFRNGPAGMGTTVYPTDARATISEFVERGFECVFFVENQNSILPNKKDVKWARVVLEKQC